MLAVLQQLRTTVSSSGKQDHDAYQTSLRVICGAVPILECHMATYNDYVEYLQHRSQRLSSVVSVLIGDRSRSKAGPDFQDPSPWNKACLLQPFPDDTLSV
jgi:hypothetical protein